MSRILRQITEAPSVFIGERRLDAHAEEQAEKKLGVLFPRVSFVTAPDGAKLIPIQQVYNLETVLQSQKQDAYNDGFSAGHRQGLEEGLNEARTVLARLNAAINDAVTQREVLLDEAKQQILQLVVQISRKVTCEAIQIDREATALMIANIINGLTDRSSLRIKVHPDFLPVIEQNIDRYLKGQAMAKELIFEPDPRIRLGGCFIQTPTGDIDARLESQFEVVRDTVLAEEPQP